MDASKTNGPPFGGPFVVDWARLLSRGGCRSWGRSGFWGRRWCRSGSRRCRRWFGRSRRRGRRGGGRRLGGRRSLFAAASAKNIIRNNGQDNDNKGDQPPAAATTRRGRRARRGEGVIRVRHETCPPWNERLQSTAINARFHNRFHAGGRKALKNRHFPLPSRQTTQLTAVTIYPALRKSSTSPSGPGRCNAPTAMKALPLARIGMAWATITLLRLVIMVCSKAA